MPEPLFDALRAWLETRDEDTEPEEGVEGVVRSSRVDAPSELVTLEAAPELETEVFASIQPMLEAWCGQRLVRSKVYGARIYHEGAVLYRHVDLIETHIVSAVLLIAQDVDRPWPLVLESPEGERHEVTLEPGDALLYEGARLPHYRDEPLDGRAYAAVFVHFRPTWWSWTDERLAAADGIPPLPSLDYGSDEPVPSPAPGTYQGHIGFQPDYGGLNNVLMQLELMVGLAWLTGRTLFLPPPSPLYLLGDEPLDLGAFFDLDRLARFVKVEPTKPFKDAEMYAEWMESNAVVPAWNSIDDVLVHPPSPDVTRDDRRIVSLEDEGMDADILYFPMTEAHRMFGVAEDFFALGDDGLRRRMRRLLRDATRYRPEIVALAERARRAPVLGRDFAAMHIRRGDFWYLYAPTQIRADRILEHTKGVLTPGQTIYVATDEPDLSFLDPMRERFHVVTFGDLDVTGDTPAHWTGIVETLVCAAAPGSFVGTRLSTFSTRIATLRGHLSMTTAGQAAGIDPTLHHTQPWWESGDIPVWAQVFPEVWRETDDIEEEATDA